MSDTQTLITRLSSEVNAKKPMQSATYQTFRLMAVLALYAVATQSVIGIRTDLSLQFTRIYFTAEIILLAALAVSSVIASVIAMYPDSYQKPKLLLLPYAIFILLTFLIGFQLFLPPDANMVMPLPDSHTVECALCIGVVAIVPSAIIFAIIRKGASVHPLQAGSFAVLSASAIGCLTLRLAEAIDSIPHLVIWHYLPTIIFACIGALIGKCLLKW